jgi:hypothetical protein
VKHSRSNTLRIAITVLLAAVLLASLAMPALAADNEDSPTWGVNMQRTRCIDSSDNIYQSYVTYNSTAQYCQLDSNLQSFSTPTCYTNSSGTDVVQAYGSEGENGYLYGLQESNKAISALWGGSIAFATQSTYEAACAAGPTTDTDHGYTAMGVGTLLYAWPNQNVSAQTPAANLSGSVNFQIAGNPPGNSDSTTYQVDMNPAITPNLITWTGYDVVIRS